MGAELVLPSDSKLPKNSFQTTARVGMVKCRSGFLSRFLGLAALRSLQTSNGRRGLCSQTVHFERKQGGQTSGFNGLRVRQATGGRSGSQVVFGRIHVSNNERRSARVDFLAVASADSHELLVGFAIGVADLLRVFCFPNRIVQLLGRNIRGVFGVILARGHFDLERVLAGRVRSSRLSRVQIKRNAQRAL